MLLPSFFDESTIIRVIVFDGDTVGAGTGFKSLLCLQGSRRVGGLLKVHIREPTVGVDKYCCYVVPCNGRSTLELSQ
jgi:hypothetical protein